MLKFASLIAFAFALTGLTGFAATAAPLSQPQVSTPADASYQLAANWNERICCKRGWQDWWSTRRACERRGGHQVRPRQCRDDWNERWDNRWFGWQGGDWNKRVCCKVGRRDWWTSARECREAYGYEAPRRECRNG